MRLRNRLTKPGLLATMATLALTAAPAAHADLLTTAASNCGTPSLSQPFLPWLDLSSYTPVPGGTFESGSPSWTLSGGAAVAPGNESYFVDGASDSSSLSLPPGGSATSPAMCVGISSPTLRLFDRNTGSPTSSLRVDVLFQDAFGNTESLPIATLSGSASWATTPVIPIIANLLPLVPGDETPVAFRFTPQGSDGAWQIDDAYVDPWQRAG